MKKIAVFLIVVLVAVSAQAFQMPFNFKLDSVQKFRVDEKIYYYFEAKRDVYYEGKYFFGEYTTGKLGKEFLYNEIVSRIMKSGGSKIEDNLFAIPSPDGDYILKLNFWNFKYSIVCIKKNDFRKNMHFDITSKEPYPIFKEWAGSKTTLIKHSDFNEYDFYYYKGNKKINNIIKGEMWELYSYIPKNEEATYFELNNNLVFEAKKNNGRVYVDQPHTRTQIFSFDAPEGKYWMMTHTVDNRVNLVIMLEKNFEKSMNMDISDWKSDFEKTGKLTLRGVQFEFNKSKLMPESGAVLDKAVELLNKYSGTVIEIAGHTDNVGTKSYNHKLSQERAESVRMYLVEKGVAADRLSAIGYGDEKPVDSNDTEEGRSNNRRVELVKIKDNSANFASEDFEAVFTPFPGSKVVTNQYPDKMLELKIYKNGKPEIIQLDGERRLTHYDVFDENGKLNKKLTPAEMKENYIQEVKRQGGEIVYESKQDLVYRFKNSTGSAWVRMHTIGHKYSVDVIFTK